MKSFIQPVAAILSSADLVTAAPASSPNQVEKRYVPGQCGVHVTQYQRNEDGAGGDYTFDVRIYDAIQATIGGTNDLAIPASTPGMYPLSCPTSLSSLLVSLTPTLWLLPTGGILGTMAPGARQGFMTVDLAKWTGMSSSRISKQCILTELQWFQLLKRQLLSLTYKSILGAGWAPTFILYYLLGGHSCINMLEKLCILAPSYRRESNDSL